MSSNLKRKSSEASSSFESPHKQQFSAQNPNNSKSIELVQAVYNQGYLGQLVVIQNETDNSYVTLQNALCYMNAPVNVIRDPLNQSVFVLKIGEEVYAAGEYATVQMARVALAQEALEKLKKTCFFIEKKKCYVDITTQDVAAASSGSSKFEERAPKFDEGSVAHKMMQKMGWSTGRGLGSQEQGNVDAVTVIENISRRGLGNKNIMKEITTILDNFSRSSKFLTTLAFASDFSKDERNLIHKVARKFNLKSKSEGKEPDRRITVARKLTRMDIVKELLKIGGENDSYKLLIPDNFAHLM